MEISTWPVFLPAMNLWEPLCSTRQKAAEGGTAVFVSDFLWCEQQRQRSPQPRTLIYPRQHLLTARRL